MPQLNTRLESEGAEFLVLGHLLVEKIPAYKAYTNMKGYDLVAVWPETNRSARIQVKSRWATDAGAHLIKSFDCDFVVLVRLNRGNRYSKPYEDGKRMPEFFILPVEVARGMQVTTSLGKIEWKSENFDKYKSRWDFVSDFLQTVPTTSGQS